jgi:hypothetical protein
MKKTILYISLGVIALASGAVFAQPVTGTGANATGAANVNTPATPSVPATPSTPATPATPTTPNLPETAPGAAVDSKVQSDFGRVDANADGKISRDEAKGDLSLNSRFKKLDKDRDGALSMDEYRASAAASKSKPNS